MDPCNEFDYFFVIEVFILSELTDVVILRPAFLNGDMSTFSKDRPCWLPFKTCGVKSSGASVCAIFQEYVILSLHSTDYDCDKHLVVHWFCTQHFTNDCCISCMLP